jgi:hypothetical protein
LHNLLNQHNMSQFIIHPEEPRDLNRWATKWGISEQQVRLAIIETGCVDSRNIKEYLRKKGTFFSFRNFALKLLGAK